MTRVIVVGLIQFIILMMLCLNLLAQWLLASYSKHTIVSFTGAKTGKDNGFSVLFDIESYDYGYYDEGSEGLKVAIVHHLVSCLEITS